MIEDFNEINYQATRSNQPDVPKPITVKYVIEDKLGHL